MAETFPSWSDFRKLVQREAKKHFTGAVLVHIEVWEPEGTYSYSLRRPLPPRIYTGVNTP